MLDDEAITADRVWLWSRLLRRLDERRDPLAAVHPAVLLLACQPVRCRWSATPPRTCGRLSGSLYPEIALDAATALVDLRPERVERYPDSPTALRDLSISLNNIANIQQRRGQLDDGGVPGSRGS